MARASGLALVPRIARSAARVDPRHRRADRRRPPRRRAPRDRRRRRERDDRRWARRGRGARAGRSGATPVTVACDVSTRSSTPPRVFGPQKGASDAQVALLTRRLAQPGRPVRAAHRGRRPGARRAPAPPAGSPAAWPRSARELEPGFDVVAGAAGLESRARRRRPRRHRRGQARRHQLRGQGRGRRARVGDRRRACRTSR